MWLTLLITAISIWIFTGIWDRRKMRKIDKEIGSDIPSLPLVGHMYLFAGSDEDRMNTLRTFGEEAVKRGGLSSLWYCNKLFLCVADPEAFETVVKNCLEKDENTIKLVTDSAGYISIFAPGLSRISYSIDNGGIGYEDSLSPVERNRATFLLAHVFRSKIINELVKTYAKHSEVLVEQLRSRAGAGDVAIWRYITKFSFDAIAETNLGRNMNTQKNAEHKFVEYFEESLDIISRRLLQPWIQWDIVYFFCPSYWKNRKIMQYIYNYLDKIVKEKRKTMETHKYNESDSIKNEAKTYVELMINARSYTDAEICQETFMILMAGTDSSAIGTCFTLIMMSRYLTIQDAVYRELYEVFGNTKRPVAAEDLPKLKYLEVVIKETLRMYPPVPIITRDVTTDFKLPSGPIIKKGMGILLNVWGMHRNYKYWGEDADQFRPERFLDEPLKHPMQYTPFSHGNRNCLGQQHAMMAMKTAIATLLRSYRVLPPVGLAPKHLQDPLRIKYDVLTRECSGFTLRLEKRELLFN